MPNKEILNQQKLPKNKITSEKDAKRWQSIIGEKSYKNVLAVLQNGWNSGMNIWIFTSAKEIRGCKDLSVQDRNELIKTLRAQKPYVTWAYIERDVGFAGTQKISRGQGYPLDYWLSDPKSPEPGYSGPHH